MTGLLEGTNEDYAVAKFPGFKTCEFYRKQYGVTYDSVMPINVYWPWGNCNPENSHDFPALIRRFHEAKEQNLSKW